MTEKEQPGTGATWRIAELTDGVFAIVMTLLVLGIDVPEIPEENLDEQITYTVLNLWPRMLVYVMSFLNLGIFWLGHHSQFHFTRQVDLTLLWLNILFLMMVSLVPFTTRLVGRYGNQEISLWLYGANLILISLLLLANWTYAARKGLLEDDTGSDTIRVATRWILVGPILYAVGIGLSFLDPRLSLALFMLAPILQLLPGPFQIHWTR